MSSASTPLITLSYDSLKNNGSTRTYALELFIQEPPGLSERLMSYSETTNRGALVEQSSVPEDELARELNELAGMGSMAGPTVS